MHPQVCNFVTFAICYTVYASYSWLVRENVHVSSELLAVSCSWWRTDSRQEQRTSEMSIKYIKLIDILSLCISIWIYFIIPFVNWKHFIFHVSNFFSLILVTGGLKATFLKWYRAILCCDWFVINISGGNNTSFLFFDPLGLFE